MCLWLYWLTYVDPFDDFKYWKICNNAENLERLEKTCTYPPRFQIHCIKNTENMAVDFHLQFDIIKKTKSNDTSCIGLFSLVKNVTGDKLPNDKRSCILQYLGMCLVRQ